MTHVQALIDALGLGAVFALVAVGIGLVFGVLRLVNFAYGQLIMAGAYALAIGSSHGWPQWASVLLVEQNALMALDAADRGYVMETGRIVLADEAQALKRNEQVRKTYLGETE